MPRLQTIQMSKSRLPCMWPQETETCVVSRCYWRYVARRKGQYCVAPKAKPAMVAAAPASNHNHSKVAFTPPLPPRILSPVALPSCIYRLLRLLFFCSLVCLFFVFFLFIRVNCVVVFPWLSSRRCARQHRADPTLVDADGRSPLHVACASSRVRRKAPTVVDATTGRKTPSGYFDTVQVLLEMAGEYTTDR